MSVIKEFKEFAMKGNMLDLATGIIIGTAFGKIVTSLVNDIVMPVAGLFTGKIDFTNLFISFDGIHYETLQTAKDAGAVTLNYGLFITNIVDFLIIAFSIFFILKQINRFRCPEVSTEPAVEPTTQTCPYCLSEINIKAVKCPFCTSDLKPKNKN